MKRFNTALFLASVASCALVTTAQAQTLITGSPGPNDSDSALHATGATSIQNVLVQEFNCIGIDNSLGNANGTTTSVSNPTVLPITCNDASAANNLQPNFNAKYIGTGSGFGRQAWRSKTNQFSPTTSNLNPFNASGNWNTVQFAFADSSLTPSDIQAYDTNNVDSIGGAAVMLPKYVLPVALAYNPVYGKNPSSVDMRFRVTTTSSIGGVNVGGLRLGRVLYCGIFNGDIKNWNDSRFSAANGSQTLMDTTNDDTTRWNTYGVPIRLVGRMEKSGTTDIFTRALAAQCNSLSGVTQHYSQNSETLPYNSSSGVDFQVERSDTDLRSGGGATAGTVNMVGKEWFNPTLNGGLGDIVDSTNSVTNGATASSRPDATTGNGTGYFLVAIGSGNVAKAINFAPDFSVSNATYSGYKLNGKIGYISADFVTNSVTGAGLHAAALNNGSGTFSVPSAAAATNAVTSILPPESNSSGVYLTGDTRSVRNPAGGSNIAAKRNNPLAWYDVLYTSTSLANPSTGYPITGTTQFLGNTCYKPANRKFVANFLGWDYNTVTHDWNNVDRTGIYADGTTGLLARSNIGAMPAAWRHAIEETFLKANSAETDTNASPVGTVGALGLWIEDAGTAHCTVPTGM